MPTRAVFAPRLPAGPFSWADPARIASDLMAAIDAVCTARPRQPDGAGDRAIIVIGHSLGAIVARKVRGARERGDRVVRRGPGAGAGLGAPR